MKIGTIEKGIAVPTGREGKYDWLRRMEVGDSVVVQGEGEEKDVRARIVAAARRFGLAVVVQGIAGSDALRVWRSDKKVGKKRAKRAVKVADISESAGE